VTPDKEKVLDVSIRLLRRALNDRLRDQLGVCYDGIDISPLLPVGPDYQYPGRIHISFQAPTDAKAVQTATK
jgi:hypothetical protein